jgi:hypothetical protein
MEQRRMTDVVRLIILTLYMLVRMHTSNALIGWPVDWLLAWLRVAGWLIELSNDSSTYRTVSGDFDDLHVLSRFVRCKHRGNACVSVKWSHFVWVGWPSENVRWRHLTLSLASPNSGRKQNGARGGHIWQFCPWAKFPGLVINSDHGNSGWILECSAIVPPVNSDGWMTSTIMKIIGW